jgi:hypothetical protein
MASHSGDQMHCEKISQNEAKITIVKANAQPKLWKKKLCSKRWATSTISKKRP